MNEMILLTTQQIGFILLLAEHAPMKRFLMLEGCYQLLGLELFWL